MKISSEVFLSFPFSHFDDSCVYPYIFSFW